MLPPNPSLTSTQYPVISHPPLSSGSNHLNLTEVEVTETLTGFGGIVGGTQIHS